MRPRVLAVNFVHGLSEAEARARLTALCAALRESSRWQGYRDPAAPPFLDYQLVAIADLTELAERGLVNEVWLLADHTERSAPWETVEVKRTYDAELRPVGVTTEAGNS